MPDVDQPPGPRLQALFDEGLREVTLDVDYFAEPLWARNSDRLIGNLDLDRFELDEGLAADLRAWVREWETEIAVDPTESAPEFLVRSWRERGRTLANRVQSELRGLISVYYAYDAHPDRPVWEQR